MKISQKIAKNTVRTALVGAAMLLPIASAGAQETNESTADIEMLETDSGAPIVISSFSASGDGDSMGSMSFSDAFSGGMGGMGMGGSDAFSILSNKSVQEDLELVGDQLDTVNRIRKEFDEELRDQVEKLMSGNVDAARDLGERISEIQKAKKEKIEGLLLPHQLERLKQVQLQKKMQQRGTAATLGNKEVMEALDIDKDQLEKIKKRAKELQEELAKRTEELKEEIRGKLLEQLTSKQQEKLAELQGEKFEYKQQNIGDMIKKRMEQRRKTQEEN